MKIVWGSVGQKTYENGIDRGVLYPETGPGVPWNGLTSVVSESAVNADAFYFDGRKYMDYVLAGDYSATINALSHPDEFNICDGFDELAPGLMAADQPRESFSMCWRTYTGNDADGSEAGYKLHLMYNATASPSAITYQTNSSAPDPLTYSWKCDTVPPDISDARPTAYLVVDSRKTNASYLAILENLLYGTESTDSELPTPDEVVSILLSGGAP